MQMSSRFEFSYIPYSGARCPTLVDTDSTDIQLIERFQEGDARVFDMLYLRYQDRIYGVVRCVISNPDDALDISQDVFLKAYQGLQHFKKASQFYSWLYRIAINCCIDHMRRQSKHACLATSLYPMKFITINPSIPPRGWKMRSFGAFYTPRSQP